MSFHNWQQCTIIHRWDGSYVIGKDDAFPGYHVPNNDEFVSLYAEVDAYAQAHPEQVTDEPAPPEPTPEELLERAKTLKAAEFDRAMADIDAELIRSTTDIVAAMLTPATLVADEADSINTMNTDELEQSREVFTALRQIQIQNRALRAQVEAAETVEAVQAIEPVTVDRAALAAGETA